MYALKPFRVDEYEGTKNVKLQPTPIVSELDKLPSPPIGEILRNTDAGELPRL